MTTRPAANRSDRRDAENRSQEPAVSLRRRTLLGASAAAMLCGTLFIAGCGKETGKPAAGAAAAPAGEAGAAAPAAAKAAKKIGIVQLVTHEALDDAVRGFQERLAELGYSASGSKGAIAMDLQNAHGDSATLQAIASRFVADKCDLIYAVSTPALQAAARATRTIPIVATAVTSFERAKVVKSDEKPGGNVTGVSNAGPIGAQLDLLLSLLPKDAPRVVGAIYTASEDNSLVQLERFKKAAEEKGVKVVETAVSSVNDIQQCVSSLSGKVAGMWVPTDNVLASGAPILAKAAIHAKIPLIAGDLAFVQGGCLAAVTLSHYELGRMTADMAADILEGKSKPADMPIQYAKKTLNVWNKAAAEALGIPIPAGVDVL